MLSITANTGPPNAEVCMSSIQNHNFSIYFNLPTLKKRVFDRKHSTAISRIENERERRWGSKNAVYGWTLTNTFVCLRKHLAK